MTTPYSDRAMTAGVDSVQEEFGERGLGEADLIVSVILDAAHDRSVLGLDASARVGDVLDEVTDLFPDWLHWFEEGQQDETFREFLLREFEAKP